MAAVGRNYPGQSEATAAAAAPPPLVLALAIVSMACSGRTCGSVGILVAGGKREHA